MTRKDLSEVRSGTPLRVRLDDGRDARATFHSLRIVGKGRSARTYVCVLLQPHDRPTRVHIARVERIGY